MQKKAPSAVLQQAEESPGGRLTRSPEKRSALLSYAIAVLSVAAATLISLWVAPHSYKTPFLLFYPAVVVAVWFGGFRPGLLATVLAALSVNYFLLPPYDSFNLDFPSLLQTGFFALTFASICWFTDLARKQFYSVIGVQTEMLRQRNAELEAERARWQGVVEGIADEVWLCDAQGKISLVNLPNVTQMELEEFRDKSIQEVLEEVEITYLDGQPRPPEQAPLLRSLRGEVCRGEEIMRHRRSGKTRYRQFSSAPTRDGTGAITGAVAIVRDITESKQAQQELQKLSRTLQAVNNSNQALLRATTEAALLQDVCRIVTEDCGYAMVWVGYAEQDEGKTVRPVAHSGFDEGYLESARVTWADTERGRGPTGTAIRSGQPRLCRNMLTEPQSEPWREEALKRGYASSLALPLLAGGKSFGAITIYSREPNAFAKEEVELLTELAGDLSYGISALRTRAAHEQAEEALRESEQRYRLLFETMMNGFALCRMLFDDRRQPVDFVYMGVNAAFADLTGIRDNVVGKRFSEVFPEGKNLNPELLDIYGRIVETGQPEQFEIHFKPLDSWLSVVAYRTQGEDFVAIFDDITERKRAEAALRDSEQQFRNLANAIPQLCWMANADGWIFWYNQRWYEYTGTTPEQMEGWGWQSVHDPNELPKVLERWKGSIASGLPFDMVFPLRGADGIFRPFLTRILPVKNTDGVVVHWFGTNTDITELRNAQEAMRHSEERLAAVVGSAMDAIITVDQEQRIVMFNAAAERTFGCLASEAIGESLDRFIPDRFREAHRRHVRNFGEKGMTSRSMQCPATLYGRRADGREFPIEATISHVEAGGQKLYTVILRDITQRKQTEEVLMRSEKLATVGRLAATIAHEINNPLSAVTNMLFLLRSDNSINPASRQYLELAEVELQRAGQIANTTLGLSKQGASPAKFRPAEILDGVLALVSRKLEGKGVKIQKAYRADHLEIIGVAGEIRQVLWNLVSNAVDAIAGDGRIIVRVRDSADRRRPTIRGARFTIADTGCGMTREALQRIFEPFFTTKHTGTGLGLWVTSEIVHKHGGSIKVRSRKGSTQHGTVFSIFIPADGQPLQQQRQSSTTPRDDKAIHRAV